MTVYWFALIPFLLLVFTMFDALPDSERATDDRDTEQPPRRP